MKLKHIFGTAAAAATFLWAGVANAALYNFSLSGGYTAQWQLDTAVVPDLVAAGQGFTLQDVAGSYPGAVGALADLIFYNAALDGGLEIYDFDGQATLFLADGPQLYTGSEAAPVFRLGTFALSQVGGPGAYTLTVTAVPEPATYGMMLAGVALLGVAARRRRS